MGWPSAFAVVASSSLIFGALPDQLCYVWRGFEPPSLGPNYDADIATVVFTKTYHTVFPITLFRHGIRFELWGEPCVEQRQNTWYYKEEWQGFLTN